MILFYGIFFSFLYVRICNGIVFDYYTGQKASEEQLDEYRAKGNLNVCTIDVEPCCKCDWKRVDGSCNNIDNPARGTFFVPLKRVLPALYYNGSYSRKAASGKDLLWPRTIRRVLLSEGKFSDPCFTQSMNSYGIFMVGDVVSIHDILYFLRNKTDCCSTGMNDYMCTPNFVDPEDSLNRLGGVSCMNMTRPLTYQYFGCTEDAIPSPVIQATATFDLSQIYNARNKGEKAIRTYEGGKIIMEVENNKTWPEHGNGYCPLNKPGERCFGNHPTNLLPVMVFAIWFMRLHNYFATQLAIVNPCWSDQKLFYTARDMNIACAMQMFLYEWLCQLEGHTNLKDAGIIYDGDDYRECYDPDLYPCNTLEYTFIYRYFHTTQEASADMFDKNGTRVKTYPLFGITFHPGFLVEDDNMEQLTQGQFRQAGGRLDQSIDYDVADYGMGPIHKAADLTTSDLHKGRLLGLRPYIDYIEYCTGHKITCFEDLLDHVDRDSIHELKKVYEDPSDIDLLAGIWVEKFIPGGHLPRTLACLINDNLINAIKADRHWYERRHRPHAFKKHQLKEIRKFNLALLLCTVGDGVTEIQRHAFLNICPETNPLVKCSEIPSFNFSAWADPACKSKKKYI